MEEKKKTEATYEKKLSELGAKIDSLAVKIEKKKGDIETEYHTQMTDLKTKYDETNMKLKELKGSSKEALKDVTAGLDKAFDALSESFQNAATKFRDKEKDKKE